MTKAEDKLEEHITDEIKFRLHIVQRMASLETYIKMSRYYTMLMVALGTPCFVMVTTLALALVEKK